ncbi:hypothetical protein E1B28_013347 [Marasmius oreades]|uniref:Uncharacterized protein n=1 Tax=Marasmius oreades TaxID=181124 RepID=A0A9P7RPE1_9AGAR|nr:uncharacterized protein E1B28_013347 [Marasmius oreades]KAG7087374.1 hypothetical protein E1B28_013347 [Marasmius oreades]
MMNRDGTCALPRAVRLQGHLSNVIPTFIHEPGKILIVPQSHFHFDVNDSTRTHGLISPFDPSGEPILFPTVPALLDAVIDTLFEPVDGVFHFKFQVYLSAFLSDLVHNTITSDEDGSDEDGPLDPDTGELLPAAKELLDGLKPENSSFLETFMRTGSIGVTPEVRAERASLKSACMPKQSIKNSLSLSNKTPRNTPFPPKYQEGHQTPAGGTVGNRPLHSRSFSQYHRPPPRPLLFQSIFRMLNAKKLLTR